MAGFQKTYISENEYLYDLGKSTGYFDEEYYKLAKESGKEFEYLQLMASAKDNISSSFDPVLYDKLSGEEKFNYFATENFADKSSDEYRQANEYYKQRQQQIQNQEIYDGLNDFQKVVNSIGGWIGNSFVQLGSITEGLIDAGAMLAGAFGIVSEEDTKKFIAQDTTGYAAAQTAMNDWINKYTFIDKNVVTKAINDVSTGIVRMTPMIVGSVLAPVTGGASAIVGTTAYYASMAGNTAEQAIQANPDINYGDLVLYTGATVGLEALTEWASAKLFGDDIISSMMKGQKYAPTGSIVKNIAKNFGTEALEEATSELFGSMLYKAMIDPTAEIASFEDILYAAIIGGLTGSVMSGGQVLTTKRMAVLDGKIVPVSSLSKEDLKRASKLGIAKSYGLNSLISQYQQGSQTTDEVTKLMAKYGTSVNNIAITHSAEYNEAVAKDTETKTQQAKIVLDLANMLRTIGVEQFTKSAEFLNQHLEQAQTLINNYLNRRSDYNASAAQAFNKAFVNESFTPVAQPTNSEIELVNALRAAYPDKKVAFGTFGSKEGLATKSVRTTDEWIFIETGLVDKMGYKNVMQHAIRDELANNVLAELSKMSPSHVDALADLVSDNNKKYSDMTKAEKKALSQILCFDPINNKRLFFRNKEVHAKIFNYITEKANYVKRFGRRTESNKIRYHDLLTIRDMFLNNIANAIFNDEDVEFVAKKYNLTPEEVQLNIVNKTTQTTLNDVLKVTKLSFSKASILKREAIDELISNRADTTTDFDYNRIYDESYYNPVWVSQIKEQQKNQDFAQALKAHFELSLKTTLDDYNAFTNVLLNNVSPKDFKKLAKTILTKEYLDTNPSETAIMATVANKLWTMTDVVLDDSVDSIVITDNQIQGTGELKFFKGDVYEQISVSSPDGTRTDGVDSGRQVPRLVANTRQHSTTEIDKYQLEVQTSDSLEEYQKTLVDITREAYGVELSFYKGAVHKNSKYTSANVHGFYIEGTNKVYIKDDENESLRTIITSVRHEVMHFLFAANPDLYIELVDQLEWIDTDFNMSYMDLRRDIIKSTYDDATYDELTEEAVVDAILNAEQRGDVSTQLTLVNKAANEFYKKAMNAKYSWLFTENLTTGSDTNIKNKLSQKGKIVQNLLKPRKKLTDFPTTTTVTRPTIGEYHATWTQDRLNDLIERSGSTNPNYATSYAAYMTIDQFLKLSTTSDTGRTNSISAVKEDYERQSDVNYSEILKDKGVVVPHLIINADTMRVEDHDGRHRLIELQKQGIYWVAVKIDFEGESFDKYDAKIYETLTIKPQEFLEGTRQNYTTDIQTIVPLNESNRTNLENLFIKERIRSAAGFRFSLSKQTKQPKLANQILKQFEDGAKNLSETQFSESNSKEYSQVSYDMIDTMADTFALVNNDNYQEVRESLKKSDKKYAAQALEIFDLYTIEMVGKFNKEIQQKIENVYQKLQTEAGQRLALQAKRVATRKPISHTIATLERDGFKTTVTDELVQKYDAKLKDKDAYIKELEAQIKELEKQLKNAQNDIDKAALNKQLKEVSDKKGVIQNGSNADILDHIVTHTSSLEQAAKLQEDILEKLVATAIVAQEEGKKVGYYVYDDKGQLKPFPEASKKIAKTLKKLKSFRMWAMLSSPVTWVRNWLGNRGMRGLDSVTNFVEGFISSRTGFDERQMKFTESRAGKELYQYIASQNQAYIMSLVRGEDVKYETSTEKAADIKRRERAAQYESANAFKKACLKAQDMTDWGLSTGVFGDEPVVFQSICKNMGNLVANNINFLLQGIQVEANALNKRTSLTSAEQARLDVLNKAIQTKDAKDVFNALSKEETERLFDVCKERSFQQYFKNPNALSKWFAKFGTKHPVYAELVSWVMPFPKVAANVLSMAYRYSPLSFFKGLAELSKYKQMQRSDYKGPSTGFEKAQMIRTFSEASVGTFMLIAGAIFSAMGLIDIDEDDYMGPSIKIGDFKMSLSELAPSMTTFSTAAAVVWAWKNDKAGVTQALNVLYDNTLLGNVENLLTYGSFTDIGKNALISYTSQYIPAILKLINKGVTGGVKKDKSGNYLQRLVKTLGSYIPGVSELIPNKIDPYTGEKVYQAGAENWFLNLLASLSPVGIKWVTQSEVQRHAAALGVETTGLSGNFKINDVEYSVANKERYAKYRAEYIDTQFNKIITGKEKITVEDENGKRITTTYDKLNDKQKKNVINRLYTEATSMTKIKWWTDQGNKYVVTDRDLYNEYRKMFSNIVYKKNWSKSKFVER